MTGPMLFDIGEDVARMGAIISDCRRYRYALWRQWEAGRPSFVVIGLNPSTADETKDDPTIRRCISFAKREGCGRLVMLNLYAFRATDPGVMLAEPDPIGPIHNTVLRNYATEPNALFVAAWGATQHGAHRWRARDVEKMFPHLLCLGITKDGHPRHPLYLRADTPLVAFPSPPWRALT